LPIVTRTARVALLAGRSPAAVRASFWAPAFSCARSLRACCSRADSPLASAPASFASCRTSRWLPLTRAARAETDAPPLPVVDAELEGAVEDPDDVTVDDPEEVADAVALAPGTLALAAVVELVPVPHAATATESTSAANVAVIGLIPRRLPLTRTGNRRSPALSAC